MFRLLVLLTMGAAASMAHSAPLLRSYWGDLRIGARAQAVATDGTNVLLALYSETSRSITTALIRPDGSSVWGYETAQLATPPQVAFNGTTYLTGWVENPGASAELHGRFISRSGVLMASNFVVLAGLDASGVTGLTWDGAGFLVLWASSLEGHSVVRGQRLGPDGMPIGSVLDISSQGATATNSASAGEGNHLVVWMESTGATNEWHTRARAVMSDGSLSEVSTLSSSPALTSNPLCVSFGDGDAMAIWSREVGPYTIPCNGSVSNYWLTLFGRVLAEDGSPQGEEFQVTSMQGRQTEPKIAFDGTNYLVAWTDTRFGVCFSFTNDLTKGFAQQISKTGALVNSEFRLSSWIQSRAGAVAFAGGQFLYTARDYCGCPGSFTDDLAFLRSGGLGSGYLRNFVPETNGYLQVEFIATEALKRGYFYLQGSTNLVDWQFVPREDGPYSLFTNKVTRSVDPFPGYVGARFYRAVNPIDVCLSNLLFIDHVKAVWASENGKTGTDWPTDTDIFGPGRYLPIKPACPNGGTYYINDFLNRPTCTLSSAGHSL